MTKDIPAGVIAAGNPCRVLKPRPMEGASEKLKFEDTRYKQILMTETSNEKPWDLEERAFQFARRCRALVKRLPRVDANVIDAPSIAPRCRFGRCQLHRGE